MYLLAKVYLPNERPTDTVASSYRNASRCSEESPVQLAGTSHRCR